jgi:hypothetical protein
MTLSTALIGKPTNPLTQLSPQPVRKIQISKYAHEWTPTMHKRAQAEGNKINRRCFTCGNLKETVNHMLQCKSDQCVAARTKALQEFCKHLSRYHTPAPMANMIITSLEDWYNKKRPTITLLPTDDDDPNTTLHQLINEAYHDQCTIGWGHFLRGCIAKT